MPDSIKTVDNTKAPAAGDVDGSNETNDDGVKTCLLYTSPSPRDRQKTRMPSSA